MALKILESEINEIFFQAEDSLMQKSVLVGIAPDSMVGVKLQPSSYEEEEQQKLKCLITIECTEDEEVDEEKLEEISDAVSDWLRNQGLGESLDKIGVDPELLDWWPVAIECV